MTYVGIAEIVGVLLVSYGVLREGFAVLAKSRPYGEGRFGEGEYGGVPTPTATRLVRIGMFSRLLPRDRELTLTDRKRNGAFAIAGVIIVVAAMAVGLYL